MTNLSGKLYNKIMYCSKCKTTENLLKYTKQKMKDGSIKQYYYCRQCNTNRVGRYLKTDDGKIAFKKAAKKYALKNKVRSKAWQIAGYAEYSGRIIKKPCIVCGEKKVHKHHPDIRKPLEIVYLCAFHHKQADTI